MKTEHELRGEKVWQFPLPRVKWRAAMFLVARDVNGYEWTFAHPFTGPSELASSWACDQTPTLIGESFGV